MLLAFPGTSWCQRNIILDPNHVLVIEGDQLPRSWHIRRVIVFLPIWSKGDQFPRSWHIRSVVVMGWCLPSSNKSQSRANPCYYSDCSRLSCVEAWVKKLVLHRRMMWVWCQGSKQESDCDTDEEYEEVKEVVTRDFSLSLLRHPGPGRIHLTWFWEIWFIMEQYGFDGNYVGVYF